jgi:hypothetical protein
MRERESRVSLNQYIFAFLRHVYWEITRSKLADLTCWEHCLFYIKHFDEIPRISSLLMSSEVISVPPGLLPLSYVKRIIKHKRKSRFVFFMLFVLDILCQKFFKT